MFRYDQIINNDTCTCLPLEYMFCPMFTSSEKLPLYLIEFTGFYKYIQTHVAHFLWNIAYKYYTEAAHFHKVYDGLHKLTGYAYI